MTDLEDRLRDDLPALAGALIAGDPLAPQDRHAEERPAALAGTGPTRARARLLVAAVIVAVASAVGVAVLRGSDTDTNITATNDIRPPDSFGSWEPITDAPIPAPAYPVSAWTGSEAVFWAGSNLERNFAYSAAAAYDPAEEAWRDVVAPGWGHPGLVGAVVDGDLYAYAKGHVGRFDFDRGEWVELPTIEGIELRNIVAGDGTLWGLGTVAGDPDDDPTLTIAEYLPDERRWRKEPTTLDGPQAATTLEAVYELDQPVLWTGSAVVIWDGTQGITYQPNGDRWVELPALEPPDGELVATRAVADDRLTVVAEVAHGDERLTRIAGVDDAGRWQWAAEAMPDIDVSTSTVTAAGDWVVVLAAVGPPLSVHAPSGAWHQHADAPIQGRQGPGTVWTGSQLIVWGGSPGGNRTDDPQGMVWTAPPT